MPASTGSTRKRRETQDLDDRGPHGRDRIRRRHGILATVPVAGLRRPRCDRSRGASSFRKPPGEATITSRAPCQKLCATRGAPPQGTRSVQPFLVLSWLDSLLPDG